MKQFLTRKILFSILSIGALVILSIVAGAYFYFHKTTNTDQFPIGISPESNIEIIPTATTSIVEQISPSTVVKATIWTTSSSTVNFPVPRVVTWQDNATSPNTIVLNSISITPSLSENRGVVKSNFVLSLGFEIVSGPGSAFCISALRTMISRLLDEKGNIVGADAVQPKNDCIDKNTAMDNAIINFTVPEPKDYTFVVSESGGLPITNFTVTLLPSGIPIVRGPATEGNSSLISTSSQSRLIRDVQRVSDLNQIQGYLELYFDKYGVYPHIGPGWVSSLRSVGIMTVPRDPSPARVYNYCANAVFNGTTYLLAATLEDGESPMLSRDVDGALLPTCTGGAGAPTDCNDPSNYCVKP